MVDSVADLQELSLEAKVGQMLHVGIGHGHLETEAGWPNRDMQRAVEEIQPGGVRIYGRHGGTSHFLAQYANQIQRWAENTPHGLPPFVACDSEYGTVDVVRSGTQAYPTLMGRTATGDTQLAKRVASATARDLSAMGITVNQGPVVDVNTNPANPVIGVRSPGSDPETVSEYATAFLEGVHDEDQIAVAKHFPGHGDTESDSHHEVPHVTYDRETLDDVHLPPFEAAIEAGVDCVMTSHVVVDCIDPDRPATLSRDVLTGVLRSELGFDGVVVTDSMAMQAIADRHDLGEAAVRAIEAGVDSVLTGYVPVDSLFDARDSILDAVAAGELIESRIDESVERILRLKDRYGLGDRRYADPLEAVAVTTDPAHEETAREAYEQSFTVLGGDDALPLDAASSLLLTGVRGVSAIEPHLDAAFGDVISCSLAPADSRTGADSGPALEPEATARQLETLRSVAGDVDAAVVTTFARGSFPDGQRRIVEGLSRELPVIVVSLGFPNEFERLPEDVACVATYAQERLGRPEPFPETAGAALAETLGREPERSTARDGPIP